MDYDNNDINLRHLSDDGFIRLVIKALDTKDNEYIHKAFKSYCEREAKNDYTFGLQLLLQNLDYVHSINSLWDTIEELTSRVCLLEQKDAEIKVEKPEPVGFF